MLILDPFMLTLGRWSLTWRVFHAPPGAPEANHGALEVHHGAFHAHLGAVETHNGVFQAHTGTLLHVHLEPFKGASAMR